MRADSVPLALKQHPALIGLIGTWLQHYLVSTDKKLKNPNNPISISACHQCGFGIIFELFTANFFRVFSVIRGSFDTATYLGSWRHLSVKIFGRRCSLKNFRDETYIYIEHIYQISAQSDTWNITGGWGQVLAPFT